MEHINEGVTAERTAEQLAIEEDVRARLEQYGGEEAALEKFGLGISELAQPAGYGNHSGTWFDAVEIALIDPAKRKPGVVCPVGDRFAQAFASEGHEGVTRAVEGLKMFDPSINMTISSATIERAAEVKKKKQHAASRSGRLSLRHLRSH